MASRSHLFGVAILAGLDGLLGCMAWLAPGLAAAQQGGSAPVSVQAEPVGIPLRPDQPTGPALAQPGQAEPSPSGAAVDAHGAIGAGSSSSARERAREWMILPKGVFTLGAGLSYVTADGGLGPWPLRFTDLVFVDLDWRYSIEGRAELLAGTSLLPKQPSYTNEAAWQGAYLGARVGFAKRFALWSRLAFGPMLFSQGVWAGTEAGLQGRSTLGKAVVFQWGAGAAATRLLHRPRLPYNFWLAEVSTSAEIVLREPRGRFAAWVGSEFRFPFYDTPDADAWAPLTGPYLDAQTRSNFHLGMVVALVKEWDVFVRWIVVDRGDLGLVATTLPILPGGFDQRHLVFGMVRRFAAESKDRGPKLPLTY